VRILKELGEERSTVDSLKLKGEAAERGHPLVFCKRVRNRLMAKGLGKHSFLRSAKEYENKGVNFVRFVAKSEKSEGRGEGMVILWLRSEWCRGESEEEKADPSLRSG
jgi:hypothetical protein